MTQQRPPRGRIRVQPPEPPTDSNCASRRFWFPMFRSSRGRLRDRLKKFGASRQRPALRAKPPKAMSEQGARPHPDRFPDQRLDQALESLLSDFAFGNENGPFPAACGSAAGPLPDDPGNRVRLRFKVKKAREPFGPLRADRIPRRLRSRWETRSRTAASGNFRPR